MGAKLSSNKSIRELYKANKKLNGDITATSYDSSAEQAQTMTTISPDKSQQDEERMNAHHFALKEMFGANYTQTVRENINFNSTSTQVLDIGCGAGTWIMDMATEFPVAQFIGIDKDSLFPQTIRPANVTFKEGDVRNGLDFPDNTFDLVQIRLFLLAFDMNDWDNFFKEAYRVLKPNGYIQWMEPKMADEGNETVREFSAEVTKMMREKNQDPKIHEHLEAILSKHGFIPKEKITKAVPLKNHPLSDEFMFIIDISLDYCKPIIIGMYRLTSDEEFLDFKKNLLESRRSSSAATWSCVAAQKP